jgi:hypothetical protein
LQLLPSVATAAFNCNCCRTGKGHLVLSLSPSLLFVHSLSSRGPREKRGKERERARESERERERERERKSERERYLFLEEVFSAKYCLHGRAAQKDIVPMPQSHWYLHHTGHCCIFMHTHKHTHTHTHTHTQPHTHTEKQEGRTCIAR